MPRCHKAAALTGASNDLCATATELARSAGDQVLNFFEHLAEGTLFRPRGFRAEFRDTVLVFGCEGAFYGADL
jgi:hypothetical protein